MRFIPRHTRVTASHAYHQRDAKYVHNYEAHRRIIFCLQIHRLRIHDTSGFGLISGLSCRAHLHVNVVMIRRCRISGAPIGERLSCCGLVRYLQFVVPFPTEILSAQERNKWIEIFANFIIAPVVIYRTGSDITHDAPCASQFPPGVDGADKRATRSLRRR